MSGLGPGITADGADSLYVRYRDSLEVLAELGRKSRQFLGIAVAIAVPYLLTGS